MSLAPKIDEIALTITQQDIDIVFITETWLRQSIPNDPINIKGYQLFRRDRTNRLHGGVCLYVKNSIESKILTDLYNDYHEVLWCLLRPKRLPRGFSHIIAAVVYHPPDANNISMKEYLKNSLEFIESNYPNSAIILGGDFNKLCFKSPAKLFHLKPIINFPTRGNNILDQIFTNLQDFYMAPNRRCPFGLSDHLTITIFPAIRQKSVSEKKIIKVRDKRRSNISSLGRFFQNVPFEDILSSVQSPCEKLTIFTDIINYGLNTIMPERSIKVHVTDRPWMTNTLKRLINKRQKAFATGNEPLFSFLRNKVNRERKRCREIYYKTKVQDLKNTKPSQWWREVKQLCGCKTTNRKDLRSILRINNDCSDQVLAT